MSELKNVTKIIQPTEVSDGAGVKLKRIIGSQQLDHLDPFLLFDDFGSDNSDDYIAGFPSHPHRGIETVTYMLEGSFRHEDSVGNKGTMESGSVQWMTAGKGIIHSEMPLMKEGKLRGFQLWINLPASQKMKIPEYQNIEPKYIPKIKSQKGFQVSLIAGLFEGKFGPIKDGFVDPVYLDVKFETLTTFEHFANILHNAFIYVVEGSVTIADNDQVIKKYEMAILGKGERIKVISVEEKSRILFISGKPINEPIARLGPFVMNTKEEIIQAVKDFNENKLC
jgi:redox-sensitive bicupin YhaK (pirin superfamily)|tara:strand:- start:838 stop:1680 length:843 start_codon:yes stop_codon:yes gene_type:complete